MLTDVIVALASPVGQSAIAIVRLSGRGAHQVAASVLSPFEVQPARFARKAKAVQPTVGEILDEVIYLSYAGPHSYTGEDMVEIFSHGGLLVPGEVIAALMTAGARPALPGEFTRRALMNGKLDLLQAEAVGDLVTATAPLQRRAALGQLERGLSARVGVLRDQVLHLETLCCYEIDFPEEDSGPISNQQVHDATEAVRRSLADLLATADAGERLRDGALCVIAGRPNVGKSTLFNALLGTDRAIVTATPGTTRDAIEAAARFEGFPFRLVDTAGLRETDEHVERMGVDVTLRYLEKADIVLYCSDSASEEHAETLELIRSFGKSYLVIRTKADLVGRECRQRAPPDTIFVSALTGSGLPGLHRELVRSMFTVVGSTLGSEPVITRARHRVALETALAEVEAFGSSRASGVETVVAATHLRAAVTALETLVGLVTPEEVLDRVFASFCVGK